MALRVHAISSEEHHRGPVGDGVRLLGFRDLVAIVTDAPFVAEVPDDEALARHTRIVGEAFSHGELLPLMPGTMFRNEAALLGWMELHYVALSEGLAFVVDRVGARVHVASVESDGAAGDSGTDLAVTAAELMRTLRRRAVAAIPLRREHTTGIAIGVSFLVERTLWREFEQEVASIAVDGGNTRISLTGPWPPYDFVRIELGA